MAVLVATAKGDATATAAALASFVALVADTPLGRVARGERPTVLDVAADVLAIESARTLRSA